MFISSYLSEIIGDVFPVTLQSGKQNFYNYSWGGGSKSKPIGV